MFKERSIVDLESTNSLKRLQMYEEPNERGKERDKRDKRESACV